jgi:hypothetical protein
VLRLLPNDLGGIIPVHQQRIIILASRVDRIFCVFSKRTPCLFMGTSYGVVACGGRRVSCASLCQCSTVVYSRATSGGDKMVGVGAIKRWLTSPRVGGGFALLEIKLQALLDWSVGAQSKRGRREFVLHRQLHDDLTAGGGNMVVLPHRAWGWKWPLMRLCGTCILNG